MAALDEILRDLGYRLVEDAWDSDGRRTYVHDESADRSHLKEMRRALATAGWQPNRGKLRSFLSGAEEIEIEPGGADTSGHFLHHMKITV